MALFLICDFGIEGPYVGQVLWRLHQEVPRVPVFSLLTNAPAFDAFHSAYLVAAYSRPSSEGDVFLCVVDPGVGSERAGLALLADGRWYVGPDNGLLAIAAKWSRQAKWWRLPPPPADSSLSFHGRDWFAPQAARLAQQPAATGWLESASPTVGEDWPLDLAEIVYLDHYGNALTGLRAAGLPRNARLRVAGENVMPAQVFSKVSPGTAFWYENANGLAEIAVNRGNAGQSLGLEVGSPVEVLAD